MSELLPLPFLVLPGNGSDKKDDKNDKKARLPKSEGECECVVDDSNKSTPHTHTTQNKTRRRKATYGMPRVLYPCRCLYAPIVPILVKYNSKDLTALKLRD